MILQSTLGLAILAYVYYATNGDAIPAVAVIPPLIAILVVSYVSAFVYVRTWYVSMSRALAEKAAATAAVKSELVVGE